jgi:hypothetical protein
VYEILTIFTGFVFFCSITAGGIARTWVSGAIVFTAFGWLIGPLALDLVDLKVDREGLRALAEVTLAMVLFTRCGERRPGCSQAQHGPSPAAASGWPAAYNRARFRCWIRTT